MLCSQRLCLRSPRKAIIRKKKTSRWKIQRDLTQAHEKRMQSFIEAHEKLFDSDFKTPAHAKDIARIEAVSLLGLLAIIFCLLFRCFM